MKFNISSITTGLSAAVRNLSVSFRKTSPKIFLIGGIAGVVGGVVSACVGTVGAVDDIREAKEELEEINDRLENEEEYTEEDAVVEKNSVYRRTVYSVGKRYLPALIIIAVSISAIVCSHNILQARNVALAAAFSAEKAHFEEYRKRVAARYGPEADNDILLGKETKKVVTQIDDDTGVLEDKAVVTKPIGSWTFRFEKYDENGNPLFSAATGDPYTDMTMLKGIMRSWNDRYNIYGTVFMNDIFKELGHKKTIRGQCEGWHKDVNDPDDISYIDFCPRIETVTDKNGDAYECVILTFNVMGNVISGLGDNAA